MERIRWWGLLLLVVLGAGCVQPPAVAPARTYTYESGRTPYSAAICIARNARKLANVAAEERLLGESAWEVVVRTGTDTLAIAEVRNRGAGSVVSIRPTASPRGDPGAFAQSLMADCQARLVSQ